LDPKAREEGMSGKLGHFYALQDVGRKLDVGNPGDAATRSLRERLEKAFWSRKADEYRDLVCHEFFEKQVWDRIRRDYLDRVIRHEEEVPFTGILTFYTRHPGLLEHGGIHFFFDWNKVCLPDNLFRFVNPSLQEYLCQEHQCSLSCSTGNTPTPECLQEAIGVFLENLDYSPSALVDRELPVKQGFALDLTEMPRDSLKCMALFLALIRLKSSLERAENVRKNPAIVRKGRFIPWQEAEAVFEEMGDLDSESLSFMKNLFGQLAMLPMMTGNEKNRLHMENMPYRLSHLLGLPIFFLTMPRANTFYFFHFGLGEHGDRTVPMTHEQARPPSGTLALYSNLKEPLEDIVVCGIHDLLHIAMSSLCRMEYAHLVAHAQSKAGQLDAYQRAFAFVSHDFGNTLRQIKGCDDLEQCKDIFRCVTYVVRACRLHIQDTLSTQADVRQSPSESSQMFRLWSSLGGRSVGRIVENAFSQSVGSPVTITVDDEAVSDKELDLRVFAMVIELARNVAKHGERGSPVQGEIALIPYNGDKMLVQAKSGFHYRSYFEGIEKRLRYGNLRLKGVHLIWEFCNELNASGRPLSVADACSMWRFEPVEKIGRDDERGHVLFQSPALMMIKARMSV